MRQPPTLHSPPGAQHPQSGDGEAARKDLGGRREVSTPQAIGAATHPRLQARRSLRSLSRAGSPKGSSLLYPSNGVASAWGARGNNPCGHMLLWGLEVTPRVMRWGLNQNPHSAVTQQNEVYKWVLIRHTRRSPAQSLKLHGRGLQRAEPKLSILGARSPLGAQVLSMPRSQQNTSMVLFNSEAAQHSPSLCHKSFALTHA